MKIAVPQMGDLIAPCFDAASVFCLAEVTAGRLEGTNSVRCEGSEGYRRVRLLRVHDVQVLICNGIKALYRDTLVASGVQVISKVSGPIADAVEAYLAGRLQIEIGDVDDTHSAMPMPHTELVDWARELFTRLGYRVNDGPGSDAFLVDLVAEMICPSCNRPVKVAICCGAHTYRSTLEISEFHHTTPLAYHARVYVCPAGPATVECCRAYGIQLIDPKRVDENRVKATRGAIPLLEQPVRGHDEATLAGTD
jgi:predicted Fe-Mo cluster-binding NifX family protein